MKAAEYRSMMAESMSEQQLQDHVVALATRLGWLSYHTYSSVRSAPGFPDLVMVRGTCMFRELKAANGVVSKHQRVWLQALKVAGVDADVWRPMDLMSGRIERELRHG